MRQEKRIALAPWLVLAALSACTTTSEPAHMVTMPMPTPRAVHVTDIETDGTGTTTDHHVSSEPVADSEEHGPASLEGQRTLRVDDVTFGDQHLERVRHTFTLVNTGDHEVVFVSAQVTQATVLDRTRTDFPIYVPPGESIDFTVTNTIRAEEHEKHSRATLITKTGEEIHLTLVAAQAR